jgi:hypothetical protein
MWSKIRFELLWSQGQAIGRIKEKYTSCIGSLEGDAPSAPIFPARQRGIVNQDGGAAAPRKNGTTRRSSLHPKPCIPSASYKLGLSSGRLVSRTTGEAEAVEVALVAWEAMLLW